MSLTSNFTSASGVRFLHTSDWHLGRSLFGHSLLEDQRFALCEILSLIDQRKPHALLIAGDVFDRALPPESAVALFDWFLDEVAVRRSIPVFVIPGNHDSRERVGYASSLLRSCDVTIFAKLEDCHRPIQIRNEAGEAVTVYGLPFTEPAEIAHHLGDASIRTPDQATRAMCRRLVAEAADQRPRLLLCHAFVAGGEVSESEKEIFIGGSGHVMADAFDGFTYVALGHLHKPQAVGREGIRYSGSPFPYSKSEIGVPKSVTEVCIATDGGISIQSRSLTARRGLRYKEGPLTELIAAGEDDPESGDYILAGYTDSGAVLEAFSRLRQVYPNLLHVSRAGGYVPTSLPALARERETMSDLELFTEFFREATGSDLDQVEEAALLEVLAAGSPS